MTAIIAFIKANPSLVLNILGGIGMILTGTGVVGDAEWLKYQAIAQAILNLFLPSVLPAKEAPK